MEISNHRNKSALNKLNSSFSIRNDYYSNPKDNANENNSFHIREDKGKSLKNTDKILNTRFSFKLNSVKEVNLSKLNTSFKTRFTNFSIRDHSPIPSLDFNKSINFNNLNNDFFTEQIQNLKNIIRNKDELINNMRKENDELREKLVRIKYKLKKFVSSYKALKIKLEDKMKPNLMNLSNEVIRENLSTETIDLPKIRKINSTPKNKIKFDTNQVFKHEDLLILNNFSSQSIIIPEGDLSPVNNRNRSFILSNSVENRNMDFSFRSIDNIPKFYNEKNDNNTISATLLHENLPKSYSEKKMLEQIKTKTKNLLEFYRNKVENVKFLN